ncbi:methionine ABC transporter ATP-binding protein [Microbacterium trichothecenolyticum]|uniref:D-methionine transport system ATP-binding protein n=1 Tax=Microbacterium trichothecenolyticum TaxID=69370 RepID=A0ABU0TZ40_MICTR|nr:ATP-binding cassette domain-containing protein [Microbacterium trichothecenolyticum]MDQ1124929.1 D-methionine transport system ATP-binding protein [Microbacterium trichothecenolyticum]
MSAAIVFENVSKSFDIEGRRVEALHGVDLAIESGEIFGIVGYSGAGKSTLLRTVNALERPTSGRVVVDGKVISDLTGRDLYAARQGIGMIFQQFNLLRSRNVYKNIAYPMRLAGWSQDRILDRVEELLDFVGLADKALAYPSQLSGGQKQRVGIARALATDPGILISDEATSALDPETTGEVLELLRRTNRERGVTIALVTHEIDVVREIAHRVAVMDSGRVVETGSVYDVFSAPQNPTSQRFVASVLRHLPTPEVLERIRALHPGRLLHVRVTEHGDAFLSRISRVRNVDVNVVFGGVDELQGRAFGTLTVELVGADADVAAAVADLKAITSVTEIPSAPTPEAIHA